MDMRKLEELKEKLMRELDMVSSKGQLTMADITMIDTLAHAIKNLCKVIEDMEQSGGWMGGESYGYSGRKHYVRGHYSRGESYRGEPYGEGRSFRDMLEREYSTARDDRERETIRHMMDRL